MTEKVELRPSRRNVYLTGNVKLNDDSISLNNVSEKGYTYNRLSLSVDTGDGNVVFVEMMGGYSKKPMAIRAKDKNNTDIEIAWEDRLNEKIVEQVANYKVIQIQLGEDISGKFLSEYDAIKFIADNIKDGQMLTVTATRKLSVYRGETQQRLNITGIRLPYQRKDENGELLPVEKRAVFAQTVILTEDSLKVEKSDKDNGFTMLDAFAVDYIGKYENEDIKRNVLFPLQIKVPLTEVNLKVAKLLFKVPKGKVFEVTLEGKVIEGYSGKSDVPTEISEETKELIAMGLFTMEEVEKSVQIRGNRVSELEFVKPSVYKDEDGKINIRMDKSKYSEEHLYFYEQAIGGQDDDYDTSDNDEQEGDSVGDASDDWMKELGV